MPRYQQHLTVVVTDMSREAAAETLAIMADEIEAQYKHLNLVVSFGSPNLPVRLTEPSPEET